jgi:hypothetical protein
VLDANAHEFLTSFMADVASVAGYGENRLWTIARIKERLLEALAHGDNDDAWARLYGAIANLLHDTDNVLHDAADAPHAAESLRSFLRENDDLAHA